MNTSVSVVWKVLEENHCVWGSAVQGLEAFLSFAVASNRRRRLLACTSALAPPAASLSDSVKMLVVLMAQDAQPETENPFIKCSYALSREDIMN